MSELLFSRGGKNAMVEGEVGENEGWRGKSGVLPNIGRIGSSFSSSLFFVSKDARDAETKKKREREEEKEGSLF